MTGRRVIGKNWQHVATQLLPAVLLGAVAFALVLGITDPPGPGLDPDALAYMGAAEAVVEHGEYRIPSAKWTSADSTEPLAHFPPGYSTALAVPVRLGMAPKQAARLVQATAAFLTVTTLVLLVSAAASTLAGVLFALSLFAMTSMHEVHVSVLSEPLFLACMALVLAAMVWEPDRPLRAGIPAAVGVMTRYAGVALVGAAALWALTRPGTWKERVRRAGIAVLPGLVLVAAWLLRTRAVAGSGRIRRFALYGDLVPTLAQSAATLTAWLVPDSGVEAGPFPYHRGMVAVAAGFVLVTLAAIGWWRVSRAARKATAPHDGVSPRERGDARAILAWRLVTAATLLLVCYLGVVIASRIAADPNIPLDERILAPALLLLTTLAAVGLTYWWRGTRLVIARIAVAGALLGWWFAAATTTADDARYALDWGSDFAGEQWRGSATLAWARREGAGNTLYSNWPAAVYFYLHRPARELPKAHDARTLAAFADTVRVRGGRVLLFDTQTGEFASNESLLKTRGLHTIARLTDGVVLGP